RTPALAEAGGRSEGSRPPDPVAKLRFEAQLEVRRAQKSLHALFEARDGGHQSLRYIAAAEGTEAAGSVGEASFEKRRQQGIAFRLRLDFHVIPPLPFLVA